MLKIYSTLIGLIMAAGLVMQASAAEVIVEAQALGVPVSSHNVNIYDIQSNGKWVLNKTFLTLPSTEPITRRAQQAGSIVYVLASPSGTGKGDEFGKVIRFKLDGTRIDSDAFFSFPGHADGMAVTPDSKYIFIAISEGTYAGLIYRYNIETGKFDDDFVNLGNKFVRQLCCDGNGYVYAAERTAGHVYKFSVTAQTGKYSDSVYEARSSTTLALGGACCYHPVDKCIYNGGRTSIRKLKASDLSQVVAPVDTPASFDWFYASGYINNTMYFASYQSSCIYKVSDACKATSVVGLKLQDICEYTIVDAENTWNMDEAAGSAIGANDLLVKPIYPQSGASFGATPGVKNSCVIFTNAYSRIKIADSKTLIPETGDWGMFVWVRLPAVTTASSVRCIFSNSHSAAGDLSLVSDVSSTANRLGVTFRPLGSTSTTVIDSGKTVADGTWHHVGVVRRSGNMEVWFDGSKVKTSTVTATSKIATTRNWYFGSDSDEVSGFVGYGAAFDEAVFVYPLENESMLKKLYTSVTVPTTAPVAPAQKLPTALPEEFGIQITHTFLNDTPLAMPSLLIDSSGIYWATAERKNGPFAFDRQAVVYRSADKGVTWRRYGAIDGSGISLFESGGKLCAIGMKSHIAYDYARRMITVWKDNSSVFTEVSSLNAQLPRADERLAMMAAPVVVKNNKLWQPVAHLGDGDTNMPAYVSFTVNGTSFTSGIYKNSGYGNTFQHSNYHYASTMADVLGGCAVSDGDAVGDDIAMLWPIVDERRSDGLPLGQERAAIGAINTSGNFLRRRLNMFRGGAKPFIVRYDATSKLYWSVTVPVTNSTQLALSNPAEVVDTLAVYASPDLAAWYPCGTVMNPSGDAGFAGATFAIDGDDLVIVAAVYSPDGAGKRTRADANYLAFKRIANFRSALVPFTPGRERLYVCDPESGYVYQNYRTADGEWQPGGIFMDYASNGTGIAPDGITYSCNTPAEVKARKSRIYVLSREETPARIFAFNPNGELKHIYVCPWGNADHVKPSSMDVSADGSYALIAHNYTNAYSAAEWVVPQIIKVTFANNNWETVCDNSDGYCLAPIQVAIGKNGEFFYSNYSSPARIYRYSAAGEYISTIITGSSANKTFIAVDSDGSVFGSELTGSIYKWDPTTETANIFFSRTSGYWLNASGTCALGKVWSTGRYGIVSAWDTGTAIESCPIALLYTGGGISYSTGTATQGLKWLMR